MALEIDAMVKTGIAITIPTAIRGTITMALAVLFTVSVVFFVTPLSEYSF